MDIMDYFLIVNIKILLKKIFFLNLNNLINQKFYQKF